jgi:geranylgeranyl diphosphate synthase type I
MTIQVEAPHSQVEAQAEVRSLLARVEERMSGLLAQEQARWSAVSAGDAAPVDEVTRLLAAGGKRLRPIFCLTGYLASGGTQVPAIIDAAAALEFLHAFALIHDDVLDDSPLRRGVPTTHVRHADQHMACGWQGESRRYGEGVAILAGDLAQAYADWLMADIPPLARDIWAELRIEMIIGQFVDIASAARSDVSPSLARWIAVCKSGQYTIHRPLELGAAIAGRADLGAVFKPYGAALGEAFQLRDDLLDAFGDSATSGKPAGLDFSQHKMTLLAALAIEADKNVAGLLRACAADGDPDALRDALISLGVRDKVEERIASLVGQARAAIAVAPISQVWKDELAGLAHQVAYRNR